MKWSKVWGRVIQGVGVAAVVGSQSPRFGVPVDFGSGVPQQVVQWSAAAVAILGSVGQLSGNEKAQKTNSDGTPETEPYVPPAKGA
ncbi:hypothetical protein OY671_010394 [Metschnikowia pulcherrima]|nr:hypothetical protein OY671_010394 [Metschnikowia pulcherrima]